jgi:hypothetical protein
MSLGFIVQVVFLIIALGLVLNAFWPTAMNLPGPSWAVGPRVFLWLVVELVLLALVYLLVTVLFLGAPSPVHAESLVAVGFLAASTDPVLPPAPSPSTGGYTARYWLNAALVALSIGSVAANVLAGQTAAFLGLSDIAWHWVLLGSATVTALNAAFNRTPPVTAPPNATRLLVESRVHDIRKLAGGR